MAVSAKSPVTDEIRVISNIDQSQDGGVQYFASMLVFENGLLVEVRNDLSVKWIKPSKDGDPMPGLEQPPSPTGS